MLGVHWVILPLQLSYLAEHGMEYTLGSGGLGNYALLGVCLAVLIISKNKEERTIASSSAFVNFLSGVTEPGLYGVIMKNKKYFISLTLGGLAGGIIFGATGSYITNFAFTGLFGLPAFLSSPTAVTYFISVFVTLAVSFVTTILLSKKEFNFKK
ncbi:PTS system beta-glucoside-specific EIIBCA component [compost metagenome]